MVPGRTEAQTRDACFMAAEVADEAVVVHRQIPDPIIDFGARIDDTRGMVGEAGQRAAIFLALELFRVRAGFGVEELDGVVGAGEEQELAAVVEVDGGVVCSRWCFEEFGGAEGVDDFGDFGCWGWRWRWWFGAHLGYFFLLYSWGETRLRMADRMCPRCSTGKLKFHASAKSLLLGLSKTTDGICSLEVCH